MGNLPEQAWEDRPLSREAVALSYGWAGQQDLVRNREVAKRGRDARVCVYTHTHAIVFTGALG